MCSPGSAEFSIHKGMDEFIDESVCRSYSMCKLCALTFRLYLILVYWWTYKLLCAKGTYSEFPSGTEIENLAAEDTSSSVIEIVKEHVWDRIHFKHHKFYKFESSEPFGVDLRLHVQKTKRVKIM